MNDFLRKAAVLFLSLATISYGADPVFLNPGFEANGPNYNTGYNSFKAPVANWTVIGSSGEAGVMYYTDDAFTAGTGYGSQIAGMRTGKGLSQTVSGFTPGQNYFVTWQGNARIGTGDSFMKVTAEGRVVWGDASAQHPGSFVAYTSYVFQATSSDVAISFYTPSLVDSTALIDNLEIHSTTNPVAPVVDTYPTSSSGVNVTYTSVDPGYGVPPYEPFTQLRMQGAGHWTMTVSQLRKDWRYKTSFYACDRTGGGSANDFRVGVDGTNQIGGVGFTVQHAWTNLFFTFSATGTVASLRFESLNTDGGDETVFFDAFRVTLEREVRVGTIIFVR